MRTKRRKYNAYSRTVVRLPEQPLNERVLDLAAPVVGRFATGRDAVRDAIELAITFWNANANASRFWGKPKLSSLTNLHRRMTGKKATPEDAEIFELLTQRWSDKKLDFDPRMVGAWSLEFGDNGEIHLACEMALPDGVEVEVPPPIEKRVAIAGKFLDEVRIRITATSLLSFPFMQHRGAISEDGSVTIHTKMPTVVALFAEGLLWPKGGKTVELMVQARKLDAMVLADVCCAKIDGNDDVAVLVFKPAAGESAEHDVS